jgi:hypothetical protein
MGTHPSDPLPDIGWGQHLSQNPLPRASAGSGAPVIACACSPDGAVASRLNAERIALDARTFPGHSLRAGFLTSAARRGASIFKMMDVSRHRLVDTLRGYVRDAEIFKDHAGAGLL